MIPVTLVRTENSGTFLGSFDKINWWYSLPLPLEIAKVIDLCWLGGGNHVCAAQLADRSYAIFRSHDNGYSWETVLATAERIYAFCRPQYETCLAATSGGWWRTVTGGTRWTKISTQATGCFCVKELNNEVLIAINKVSVWKSINGGVAWTAVYTPAGGLLHPAIDGTTFDLLIGIGNKLYYSSNAGSSFYDITARIPAFVAGAAITDIELTSTFGGVYSGAGWSANTATFVVQVLLSTGMLRHYFLTRTPGADGQASSMHMFECVAKFDSRSSVFNSLSSDESQTTGGTTVNATVVFTGTDGANPVMWVSNDGGNTWRTISTKLAKLYDGPDLTRLLGTGGPFVDDTYFSASWQHGALCHNYWHVYDEFYRKCQSYDMGMLLLPGYTTKTKTHQFDIVTLGTHLKTHAFDTHIHNTKWLTQDFDAIIEINRTIAHSMNRDIEKTITTPNLMRTLLELICWITYDMESRFQKTITVTSEHRAYVEKLMQASQSFDVVLVDSSIEERVSYTERLFLQPFDIGKDIAPLPWSPYSSGEDNA